MVRKLPPGRVKSLDWDPQPTRPRCQGCQLSVGTECVQHRDHSILLKSEPHKDQTHNSPALLLSLPSERKDKECKDQSRQHAPQTQKGTVWPGGPPYVNNTHHTYTFRLWKTWVIFNGNLLCFFQVLLSSQIVFCLVLVSGQSVNMASGVPNWKTVTEHHCSPLSSPGTHSSSAPCATAS